jgi:hypothetical protein
MILNIHSDASYLSEHGAKSRSGVLFYMGRHIDSQNKLTRGVILIISTILRHVMSSAAEAEIGSMFVTQRKQKLYATHWKKWDIHSHPHRYKLTTLLQQDTVIAHLNKDAPVPWTCDFIGSKTKSDKVSSMSIGAQDTKVWFITS